MLQKYFVAAISMLSAHIAISQTASVVYTSIPDSANVVPEAAPKEPVLTITGSADVYFKYDFAKSKSNSLTSFTQSHNAFSLGMASVKFEHKGEKSVL